jgi:hypothetical protein
MDTLLLVTLVIAASAIHSQKNPLLVSEAELAQPPRSNVNSNELILA